MVELFLAHGADPVEADAEPWATPRAWAEKMPRKFWSYSVPPNQTLQRSERADRRQRTGWQQLSPKILSRRNCRTRFCLVSRNPALI
jgi:hypothetical protein